MERDQIRDLLDLKYANRDIFYQVLSEMPIDAVNNLCKTVTEFRRLCASQEFWMTLWKIKVPLPLPELDIIKRLKTKYLRYASMVDLAEFISKHSDIRGYGIDIFGGKNKNETFNTLLKYSNFSPENVVISEEIFHFGVVFNNLDCLLYAINAGLRIKDANVDDLSYHQRGELVDRLFSLISEDDFRYLILGLPVHDIIRIPRQKSKNCNINLIKTLYRNEPLKLEGNFFGLSLVEAAKKKCNKLFDYLIDQMNAANLVQRDAAIYRAAYLLTEEELSDYLERFSAKLTESKKNIVHRASLDYKKELDKSKE